MHLLVYILLSLTPMPYASMMPIWHWLWTIFIALAMLGICVKGRAQDIVGSRFLIGLICLLVFWGAANLRFDWSINPEQSLSVASFFATHILLYIIVLQSLNSYNDVYRMIGCICLVPTVYAIYGLLVVFSDGEIMLWFDKWKLGKAVTSTFVNRNNFAAYMGIGIQVCAAYLVFILARQRQEMRSNALESALIKIGWLSIFIVVQITALILTGSRSGTVSALVAVSVFLLTFMSTQRSKTPFALRAIGVLMPIAGVIGIYSLSGDMLDHRLSRSFEKDPRVQMYPLQIDALSERPIQGYGLGTFEDLFREYRDETISLNFVRAHNDFLELALGVGIPSAVLFVLFIALHVLKLTFNLHLCGAHRALVLLGVTSTIQLGMHALVDFPVQVPAVSFLWCILLAQATKTLYLSRTKEYVAK